MRALSTSVVLSSIVLGGWLTGANAQSLGSDVRNALNPVQDEQAAEPGDVPVGVIPQPTVDAPGTVMGITLGELYTDNLTMAASGSPKQTSWITQIQPFLRWAGSSPRFAGLVNYQMTGYLYAGQSRHNQLAHDLAAQGRFTVLPQHFFVDGAATYRREIVDSQLSSGSGAFLLNNNQANVAMGTLSPYWVQDLDRVGTAMLRYTLGRVLYNNHGISGQHANQLSGIPDITSKAVQFSVVSPEDQIWGWNLGYSDQRIEPDFGRGIEYATAKLGISWQVNNNTQLLADVGKENQFLPDGTSRKLRASFWDAGFDWSNSRDHLKALVGHRFYGRSYQLSWAHTAALLTTVVSYVEQPTDINQQLLGRGLGQNIPPIGVSYIPSLRERQVYLMKRASASATYTMPRGKLRLALYEERRTYFTLNNLQEKIANANAAWQFDIGPFTTLTPTIGWQRYKFRDGQITHSRYAQLELVHQINPNNFGSVQLRNDSRNVHAGIAGAHDYRVNMILAQWTHLF
jgi:hypothetical protein